jgi:hypothetical protein
MKLQELILELTQIFSEVGNKDIQLILIDDESDAGSMRLKFETTTSEEITYDYHEESDEIEIYLEEV